MKGRQYNCNAITLILEENPNNVVLLTDFENKGSNTDSQYETVAPAGIRLGKEYFKDYGKVTTGASKSAEVTNEQSAKQSSDKG